MKEPNLASSENVVLFLNYLSSNFAILISFLFEAFIKFLKFLIIIRKTQKFAVKFVEKFGVSLPLKNNKWKLNCFRKLSCCLLAAQQKTNAFVIIIIIVTVMKAALAFHIIMIHFYVENRFFLTRFNYRKYLGFVCFACSSLFAFLFVLFTCISLAISHTRSISETND